MDLEHLRAASAEVATQDDDIRIKYLRSDHWVGYTRARKAVARIEELLKWPKKVRMPNLLVIGPTHRGKSMILNRVIRTHRPQPGRDAQSMPVVSMLMPEIPTVREFYKQIITATHGIARERASTSELRTVAFRVLRSVGARILIIDELHNALPAFGRERQTMLNVLRGMGNELQIPLIGAGTKDAYLAIRSDPQLENRFEPLLLPRWVADDESRSFISSYMRVLPLRRPSRIDSTPMVKLLLERSEGNVGELIELLNRVAEVAIENGEECLTQDLLSAVDYSGPTQRTNLAELYLD